MLRLLGLSLVLLAMTASHAFADDSLKGKYQLNLSDDAGWHRHSLDITSGGSDDVKGTISIDWGIGPQGRAPKPWEKVQTVPFTARWDKAGALHFQIQLKHEGTVTYDFELYPIRRTGVKPALVGIVHVNSSLDQPQPGEPIAAAGTWRHGVLATRIR